MIVLALTGHTLRALLGVVVAAPLAGISGMVAFSGVIYCVDRAGELRRAGHPGAALAATAVGLVALAACAALVVYGLTQVALKK